MDLIGLLREELRQAGLADEDPASDADDVPDADESSSGATAEAPSATLGDNQREAGESSE